jgi:NAD(P)H-hydrate epimerase
MKVLTPAQMSEADRFTIEEIGVPGASLMENAGLKVSQYIQAKFTSDYKIAIICGSGNNGGDGYVIARHLHLQNYQVTLFHKSPPKTTDSQIQFQAAQNLNIPICSIDEFIPEHFSVVVDAIFGTGLQRTIEEPWKSVIEKINQTEFVVAADIPSGIDGKTGKCCGVAVKANTTITFQLPKRGHFLVPGLEYTGELLVEKIGIVEPSGCECNLMDSNIELPERKPYGHKGSHGHLLCIGGAAGKNGAIRLAAKSALKSGCGLVTVACPQKSMDWLQQAEPELMVLPLDSETTFSSKDFDKIKNFRCDCIVIGPGLGLDGDEINLLEKVLKLDVPLIIDADALRLLSRIDKYQTKLKQRTASTTLTPHPGEFSDLSHISMDKIEADKIDLVNNLANETQSTVLLKGTCSTISSPKHPVELYCKPNSALAKGGSGDVLAGITASFIVQGLQTHEAMCNAVKIHSRAAERAAKNHTAYSATPLNLIEELPKAIKKLK